MIEEASWEAVNDAFGKLEVEGEADPRARVDIVDGVTGDRISSTRADDEGEFEIERSVRVEDAPCSVKAVVDGVESEVVPVENTPAEDCPVDCETPLITAYPGDVRNVFHAVASNKVLVAWHSKFCSAGFPGYTGGAISDADVLATYLEIDNEVDLYLQDLFVVAGNQGSTDYREQEEFPGEYDDVGEVPFGCLWAARGVLREDPEELGTTEVVWFQAERLTSGRRDVNRVETSCTAGGGCAISWQEDPEGLRPGEGEGPGTGWAGATTNSKTEIWYSFIEWEDLDIVNDNGEPLVLADNILETGRPIPYVPMMVPVRLSNNDRCVYPVNPLLETYCNEAIAGAYGIKNQCVGFVEIPLGNQGDMQPVCVVDANDNDTMDNGDLPNLANTAASRPRLNLQPRDSDGDDVTDDAWVIIVHEEDKGLGRYGILDDEAWDGNVDNVATACLDPDADQDDNCIKADVGKNQFYISFALGTPQTSAALEEDFGLVNNLVDQQALHNAPEVNWITGTFYPPMDTLNMWDFGELNYQIFNTEIARRAALMTQPLSKALLTSQDEALIAMPLFKEGIINQGGPADIMARRFAIEIDGGGGNCDDWTPGPGPGGVQPFIDDAILTCNVEDDGSLSDCQIEITGEVCVEGNQAGTEIILDGYSGGDANVELCDDFISIDVDEGTTFTGTCELQDDQVEEVGLPCTVKVVVGPGSTTGQGQQSDPVEVEDGTDLDLLDGCYDAVAEG